jgi:hypothetical protein
MKRKGLAVFSGFDLCSERTVYVRVMSLYRLLYSLSYIYVYLLDFGNGARPGLTMRR